MAPRKIIIDTDPGQDDAAAIMLALASPEIEVLGITAVAGKIVPARAHRPQCRASSPRFAAGGKSRSIPAPALRSGASW